MTQSIARIPHHGGLQRVTFSGGESIRRSLPFRAISVNVDNWSPYWYKLNPVEEYIPPFQNRVNIILPLIDNFEFVCQAPPNIDQSIIQTVSGISGNTYPVIAVFSSQQTNNDPGDSALDEAANVAFSSLSASGNSPLTVLQVDLTLYNGVYLWIRSRTKQQINISFPGGAFFESLHLINNETLLFTIPKLGQVLTVGLSDPDPAPTVNVDYRYRPFLGNAEYSIIKTGWDGANPPITGDLQTIVGSGTLTFNVVGLENVIVTVRSRTGLGTPFSEPIGIRINLSSYAFSGNVQIYGKVFYHGDAIAGLIIPLYDILNKSANTLTVTVTVVGAGTTVDVAVHPVYKPIGLQKVSKPVPYVVSNYGTIAPGNVFIAILVPGGSLVKMIFTLITAGSAGSRILIYLGTNTTQNFLLGVINGDITQVTQIDNFPPVLITTTYNYIWVFSSSAVNYNMGWALYTD